MTATPDNVLTCPDCGHQAPSTLTNAQIWRAKFRCAECGASIEGREFFPRPEKRTQKAPFPLNGPFEPKPFIELEKIGAGALRFCLYELVDPKDGAVFWVGAGAAYCWRANALSPMHSSYKQAMISEIEERGEEPLARIVSSFATKAEAQAAKIERCREVGFHYKGPPADAIKARRKSRPRLTARGSA